MIIFYLRLNMNKQKCNICGSYFYFMCNKCFNAWLEERKAVFRKRAEVLEDHELNAGPLGTGGEISGASRTVQGVSSAGYQGEV